MFLRRCFILLLVGILIPTTVWGVIETPLKLAVILQTTESIVHAKVARLNDSKTVAVVELTKTVKGKLPFERMSVDLTSDKPAATEQLLARIEVDTPLVLFLTNAAKDNQPARYTCLAYTNGSWFQISGETTSQGIRWKFQHPEIYLRRTFKGTTAELQQLTADVLSGKAKAPPLDMKEKPGLGPELPR